MAERATTAAQSAAARGGDRIDTVCLIVPAGAATVDATVAAVRRHLPHAAIVAVWGGDPHQRPMLDEQAAATWCDRGLADPTGVGWERRLVAQTARAYEWSRTAAALVALLEQGGPGLVAVARVGSAAVLGSFAVDLGTASLAVVERASSSLPSDGCAPDESDLLQRGRCSEAVVFVRSGAERALTWLDEQLLGSTLPVARWLDQLRHRFDVASVTAGSIVVGGWSPTADHDVALVDLDDLCAPEPWRFEFGARESRVRLSGDPRLAAAVRDAQPQAPSASCPITLPGGIVVDAAIRAVVAAAIREWQRGEGELPPAPYGVDNSAFMRWLEGHESWESALGRYWRAVYAQRPDLQVAFPHVHGRDAHRFRSWAASSWEMEPERSALLRVNDGSMRPIRSFGFDPAGVNVIGYLDYDQSLGHVARQLVAALHAADVPVAELNHDRTRGARRAAPTIGDRLAIYATNLIVVNADQFSFLRADHGDALFHGRRNIAYWFWELETVPTKMLEETDVVDEIWVGSRFVADAFSSATTTPVRHVPMPVPEPQPSSRTRASFELPTDRFVFLVTLDELSVPERKNPFGAIEAFSRAFAPGEGPLLVIKTMNGDRGWRNHERLLLAAADRDDVVVIDEHLSQADQMALLGGVDCLVSLHRSEGFGLPCAEAMWLGTPVIATRYSGNTDFMDDDCAAMVDAGLVHVQHGEGVYPSSAQWAEPDVDQAASWMRRLAGDPALAADLARRGRARIERLPTLADAGRSIAAALRDHGVSGGHASRRSGAR